MPTWSAPRAGREDLDRVAEAMAAARRPLILAGSGVVIADGSDALTALARATGIPVVTSMGGKGSISETDPLAVGGVGRVCPAAGRALYSGPPVGRANTPD